MNIFDNAKERIGRTLKMSHFVLLFTTKMPIVIYEIHYDFLCGILHLQFLLSSKSFVQRNTVQKKKLLHHLSRLVIVTTKCKYIHDSEIVGRL